MPDGNSAYALAYARALGTRGLTGALPARLPDEVAAMLRDGRVVFIGGFLKQLADAVTALLERPIGLGGYFDAQRRALVLQGIDRLALSPSEWLAGAWPPLAESPTSGAPVSPPAAAGQE